MCGLRRAGRGRLELQFHLGQVQQAGGVFGLELDQEVDVAVGSESSRRADPNSARLRMPWVRANAPHLAKIGQRQ